MDDKSNRPKIKVRRDTLDWIMEFIAFSFMVFLIVFPLIYSGSLPDKIPAHFNGSGQVDSYGSKATIWLLPVTGLVLYIGLTILENFPQIYNYPVQITEENAAKQYKMATRLMRILKTIVLIIFAFLSYKTIEIALGTGTGLGKSFLPVFLLVTFGVILIYIVRSLNNRFRS